MGLNLKPKVSNYLNIKTAESDIQEQSNNRIIREE